MTPTDVLHALGDVVLILDREQRVTASYGRWIQTGTSRPSQFLGKTIAEAWPADLAALHTEMNARGLNGQVVVYDWEFPLPGSGRRKLTVIVPIYSGGKVSGVIRSSRDLDNGARVVAAQAVQLALRHDALDRSSKTVARKTVKGRKESARSGDHGPLPEDIQRIIFKLSPRERVVVGHLLDSARAPEIARDLKLSVHTVRQHVKHILQKTEVHSQRELLQVLLRGKRQR